MTWHKYRASKVQHDGRNFASKLEAALYGQLRLLERAGELRDLVCQVSVYLTAARIQYVADFAFHEVKRGLTVYCEAKGYETSDWRIKRRLWTRYGPGPLQIWKGTAKRLTMTEEIVPFERGGEA